jgi:hypothetical protein
MGDPEATGQQSPADDEEQPDTTVQQDTNPQPTDQPSTGDDTDSPGAIWNG